MSLKMTLRQISDNGPDALYDLYYGDEVVLKNVTLKQLGEAIERMAAKENKRHE